MKGLLKGVAIAPIRFYQLFISPMFPAACRFTPTCSQYAIDAIREHGALKGIALATRRICRCHPWGGSGYDPVPPRKEGESARNKRCQEGEQRR